MLVDSVLDTVGNVPLIRLARLSTGNVFAKAEFLNPGGSIKDRVAKHILETAQEAGELTARHDDHRSHIRQYRHRTGPGRCPIRVPCRVSDAGERERGAQKDHPRLWGRDPLYPRRGEPVRQPETDARDYPGEPDSYFVVNQFANPRNPETHYQQTGPEMWQDLNGQVDIFVAGVGSGGTLQGVGKFLKEQNPAVKVVAVEPKNSAALLGESQGYTRSRGSATALSRTSWT